VPEPSPTPVWVWILGAAVAIGGGIAGALWYANRSQLGSTPGPAPATQQAQPATQEPTAAPIETPPVQPQLVELRFDSLPAAGVFADGHSAELCHTPCNYTFDVKDGEHRTLVVRADGYRDKTIDVDLKADKHEIGVTLERLEPTVPDKPVTEAPLDDDTPAQPTKHPHPGGVAHGAKRPVEKTTKPDDKPVETAVKPPDPKPDDTLEKPDPTVKPKDKGDKIDPADTHDPFHRHP